MAGTFAECSFRSIGAFVCTKRRLTNFQFFQAPVDNMEADPTQPRPKKESLRCKHLGVFSLRQVYERPTIV
jgi:hypothetical protein